MAISLRLSGTFDGADCAALHSFANSLIGEGIEAAEEHEPGRSAPTRGAATVALSIATLSVSMLGVFVSLLKAYWDTRPKYTVTIRRGPDIITLAHTSKEAVLAFVKESRGDLLLEIRK